MKKKCDWCKMPFETNHPRYRACSPYCSAQLNARQSSYYKARMAIFRRDHGICFFCDYPVTQDRFHVDHLHPFLYGGETIPRNLVLACVPCNKQKHTALPTESQIRRASRLPKIVWPEIFTRAILRARSRDAFQHDSRVVLS